MNALYHLLNLKVHAIKNGVDRGISPVLLRRVFRAN